MILYALYKYYETLLENPEFNIARPCYSTAKVSHEIVIDENGEIVSIVDLRINENKKLLPRLIEVPEQLKRASGINPNFLCDNSTYVFGIDDKGKPTRAIEAFRAFREFNKSILDDIDDSGAKAFIRFLDNWVPQNINEHSIVNSFIEEIIKGSNLVFRLKNDDKYIHQRKLVDSIWQEHKKKTSSELTSQCLITGEKSPIARLHPSIKGVTGAQSAGASIVSFNLSAFESYGKTQGYNAPISEKATFAYTTALNYLLSSDKNRLRIGDTTTVFWADRLSSGLEENILAQLFDFNVESDIEEDTDKKAKVDSYTSKLVRDILSNAREGKPVLDDIREIDSETTFYILGLSPNNSRLAIRYWNVDTFGSLVDKITRHYIDMTIVKREYESEVIPIWRILKEISPLGDTKRVSPLLVGALMRSVITGTAYPQALYTNVISRIRAENIDGRDKINYIRAAIVKACLMRSTRINGINEKEVITVGLNVDSTNIAYRLGRLFALLEKVQQDANPGINATIKDRYFGAASATPGSVFPQLMRLSQHHISKASYGFSTDKKIEEVMANIESFPSHLNLEEQGLFMLGYYHQRHALYQKNERKEG